MTLFPFTWEPRCLLSTFLSLQEPPSGRWFYRSRGLFQTLSGNGGSLQQSLQQSTISLQQSTSSLHQYPPQNTRTHQKITAEPVRISCFLETLAQRGEDRWATSGEHALLHILVPLKVGLLARLMHFGYVLSYRGICRGSGD